MFSYFISPEIISGNMTATISDHLPPFSTLLLIFYQILLPKNLIVLKEIGHNLIKKTLNLTILIKTGLTYSKLIKKKLIFLWIFFEQYEIILGCTCSIKKVNKYKLKFKTKPWITFALQKSILLKITY